MGYIPKRVLANLKNYKYSGVDKSVTSKYILNPFWNWFVTLWPLSVAPNTITFLGLCIVLCNFATLLYYDPGFLTAKDSGGEAGPPNWVYFTWGFGLFFYQAFDAVDGKQARRTGMAGPLGEMFDHGCDAMNTTLEVILAARALNLGRSWWTVASQVASLANFYLTTWEEYHTGQLYLGVFSGPVEGILMICAIYIISGFKGAEFWDTSVLHFVGLDRLLPSVTEKLPDIGLNECFMVFGGLSLGFNIIGSYLNVHKARTSNQTALRPLLFLLPFVLSAALQVVWLSAPTPTDSAIVYSHLLLPFLCAWGLQFAHQVGRMILAHVVSTPFPWWDWMWVWSVVGAADVSLPLLMGRPPIIQSTPVRTAAAVYLTLLVSFVSYVRFCALVIEDITDYMGIACFTVRRKDASGVWQDTKELKASKNE